MTGFQNFLKDSLTIVKASKDEPVPWVLLLFFICMAGATALIGLAFLTCCMKRYDVTYSAAMFIGSFVVSGSIMSAIHYDTFQHLNTLSYFLYPAGLAILLSGVSVLVCEATEHEEEEESASRAPSPHIAMAMSRDKDDE